MKMRRSSGRKVKIFDLNDRINHTPMRKMAIAAKKVQAAVAQVEENGDYIVVGLDTHLRNKELMK